VKAEDFKRLSPEVQLLVLMLERIERKVDGLLYGVERLDKEDADAVGV
jgi:hypothetical protein